jgi:hypothetical protein
MRTRDSLGLTVTKAPSASGKQRSEVEVVGDEDVIIGARPIENDRIGSAWVPDLRPMHGRETR